jgi:predicted Rossmann-fold nucleotide-binding protein
LFEIISWALLGIHQKPIGLFNVAGYFDAMLACVEHAIAEGFIAPEHRQLTVSADQPAALLDALAQYIPLPVRPWRLT